MLVDQLAELGRRVGGRLDCVLEIRWKLHPTPEERVTAETHPRGGGEVGDRIGIREVVASHRGRQAPPLHRVLGRDRVEIARNRGLLRRQIGASDRGTHEHAGLTGGLGERAVCAR